VTGTRTKSGTTRREHRAPSRKKKLRHDATQKHRAPHCKTKEWRDAKTQSSAWQKQKSAASQQQKRLQCKRKSGVTQCKTQSINLQNERAARCAATQTNGALRRTKKERCDDAKKCTASQKQKVLHRKKKE